MKEKCEAQSEFEKESLATEKEEMASLNELNILA